MVCQATHTWARLANRLWVVLPNDAAKLILLLLAHLPGLVDVRRRHILQLWQPGAGIGPVCVIVLQLSGSAAQAIAQRPHDARSVSGGPEESIHNAGMLETKPHLCCSTQASLQLT